MEDVLASEVCIRLKMTAIKAKLLNILELFILFISPVRSNKEFPRPPAEYIFVR